MILETGQPFRVAYFPNSTTFAISLGHGDEKSPALIIKPTLNRSPISYGNIAVGMTAWGGDMTHYLFYFRRFVDNDLPTDVRWLNGYRLLEWHFVGKGAHLAKNAKWREFVERFQVLVEPGLRPKQTPVGLIEEARALAAHAGIDDRKPEERLRDPRNSIEKTFRAIEAMVMTVLNEHPLKPSHVRFAPRANGFSTGT